MVCLIHIFFFDWKEILIDMDPIDPRQAVEQVHCFTAYRVWTGGDISTSYMIRTYYEYVQIKQGTTNILIVTCTLISFKTHDGN